MDALVISQIRRLQRKGTLQVAASAGSIGSSTSYVTRLSVSGRGHLMAIAVRGATATQACIVRITIDGGTPTTILSDISLTDLYMPANGSNGKAAILGVPFSSSLLVEINNTSGAAQVVESRISYILS